LREFVGPAFAALGQQTRAGQYSCTAAWVPRRLVQFYHEGVDEFGGIQPPVQMVVRDLGPGVRGAVGQHQGREINPGRARETARQLLGMGGGHVQRVLQPIALVPKGPGQAEVCGVVFRHALGVKPIAPAGSMVPGQQHEVRHGGPFHEHAPTLHTLPGRRTTLNLKPRPPGRRPQHAGFTGRQHHPQLGPHVA